MSIQACTFLRRGEKPGQGEGNSLQQHKGRDAVVNGGTWYGRWNEISTDSRVWRESGTRQLASGFPVNN